MIIKVFENGFRDIEVNENDIVSFQITNIPRYTSKGTFKAFRKLFKIQVGECLYTTTENCIKTLKEALKGQYTTDKSETIQYKGFSERKAIDYWFRMIKI